MQMSHEHSNFEKKIGYLFEAVEGAARSSFCISSGLTLQNVFNTKQKLNRERKNISATFGSLRRFWQ
jgi:hypothetical protein